MSVLIVVCDRDSNSAQFHLPSSDAPSSRAKFQFSSLICGVGPAERTGKSIVTYCPGGSRSFGVCSCRLDLKPREIGVSAMESMPLLLELLTAQESSRRCPHASHQPKSAHYTAGAKSSMCRRGPLPNPTRLI